ncbi:hypothetical protein BH18THE1_BH18THE1_09390 [soil metagenome]
MKSLSCRDIGFDCDYIAQAESDYELFTKGEKHVFNSHGLKKQDFILTFNEKMKSSIKES